MAVEELITDTVDVYRLTDILTPAPVTWIGADPPPNNLMKDGDAWIHVPAMEPNEMMIYFMGPEGTVGVHKLSW